MCIRSGPIFSGMICPNTAGVMLQLIFGINVDQLDFESTASKWCAAPEKLMVVTQRSQNVVAQHMPLHFRLPERFARVKFLIDLGNKLGKHNIGNLEDVINCALVIAQTFATCADFEISNIKVEYGSKCQHTTLLIADAGQDLNVNGIGYITHEGIGDAISLILVAFYCRDFPFSSRDIISLRFDLN